MPHLTCSIIQTCSANSGERDAFMAEAVGSSPGSSLVGVVGMAHMGGIENYLVQNKGFSVVNRNCPATK